jgi:hypothetical protein
MKVNLIRECILSCVKQVQSVPRSVSTALRRFKDRRVRADSEAERLDRIRNPLKYLGK